MGDQELREFVLFEDEWNLLDQIKSLLKVRILIIYLYFN